jgi:serine/threonine protein kinase
MLQAGRLIARGQDCHVYMVVDVPDVVIKSCRECEQLMDHYTPNSGCLCKEVHCVCRRKVTLDKISRFVGGDLSSMLPPIKLVTEEWGGPCAISMKKMRQTLRQRLWHKNGYSNYFCYRGFDLDTRVLLHATLGLLQKLHRVGISVGDVKAENFMVDESGAVVLVDSGSIWHHDALSAKLFASRPYPISTPGSAHPGVMRAVFDMVTLAKGSDKMSTGTNLRWTGVIDWAAIDYNLNQVFAGTCDLPFECITLESTRGCVSRFVDDVWGFVAMTIDVVVGALFIDVLRIGQAGEWPRNPQFSDADIKARPYAFAFLYVWALACWTGTSPCVLGSMEVELTEEAANVVSCFLNGISILYECDHRNQEADKRRVRSLLLCVPAFEVGVAVDMDQIWQNIDHILNKLK